MSGRMQDRTAYIELRCMNGNPVSYTIPIGGKEIPVVVVTSQNGKLELEQESWTTKNANDICARFQASPPFLFEPLVEGVIIEPPPSDALSLFQGSANIKLPVSSDSSLSFVCLRPGDTVNFSDHAHFKFHFDIMLPASAPAVPAMAPVATAGWISDDTAFDTEVQVRSSQPEAEQIDVGANDESGSETDEEYLDHTTSTANTTRTPYLRDQDTPATSNPMTMTVGEVKETPAAHSSTMMREEQFVTALEVSDNESPLAKKTRESQDEPMHKLQLVESDSDSGTVVGAAEDEPRSDAPSEELGEPFELEPTKPAKPVVTYSKRAAKGSKQRAPVERTATAVSLTSSAEEGENINVATRSDAVNEEQDFAMTSDALDDHGVAHRAAARTIQPRGQKRGLPKAAQDEGEEDDAPVSRKRARRYPAAAEPVSPVLPKVGPSRAPAKANRSGKPAKVTRQDSADDEITVTQVQKTLKKPAARKGKVAPSPRPSISTKTPRATPDDSVMSTAMSGKAPKVIFSSSTLAEKEDIHAWLNTQGSGVLTKVTPKRSHFVCVVKNGKLATTAKILRTLALGKLIVTEDWVTDSQAEGQLLEPNDYVHDVLEKTIDFDRSVLFKGKILYFTKKLVQEYGAGWSDVTALAIECGAARVDSGSAVKAEKTARKGETVFFGAEENDQDVVELIAEQHVVYHKDLLAKGVLRGEIELDSDEFELQPATSAVKKSRKR
ncbi:hypothetical protein LTR08_004546 [Meristemomyces frigidus]|nr:hypothetical protein LTR08_004546 [Meristemomyces frigidus]